MKKKLVFVNFLIITLALIIVLLSCDNGPGGVSGTHTVRYYITGPQTIADLIFYTNETGNTDQITDVPVPWEKTITIQGRNGLICGAVIYSANGTYTAKIFVDGREIVTASSSSGSVSVSGVVQ